MTKLWTALAAAGFLMASPALATADVSFKDVDANGDEAVSMQEAKQAMPSLTAEKFKEADENGDGSLSEDEFEMLKG